MNPREQLGWGRSEYIARKASARLRKWFKKTARRAERRDAKKLLDEAPPRHWKGYAD